MGKKKCVFTTTIAETLACAKDTGGELFCMNGFPLKKCSEFPCKMYESIKERCIQIDLERDKEGGII
jgi:hypothetical protein